VAVERCLASLDHAIFCLDQADEKLSKSHEEFKIYIALYTDLLYERAEKSIKPEDVDHYISDGRIERFSGWCIRFFASLPGC
jgi:hypothetical protein